jgi:hypothetical protein
VKSKGQNDLPTPKMVAGEFKVSDSTKRDAKFATDMVLIDRPNQILKSKIH